MSAPTRRIAAFCAVSIGILCWWTSNQRGESAGDESQSRQPRLLDQDLETGAQPLLRVAERPVDAHSSFDPQVKPASSLTNVMMLAQAVPSQNGEFAIKSVSQDNLSWTIQRQGELVRLVRSGKVTISGVGATNEEIHVVIDSRKRTLEKNQPVVPSKWSVSLELTDPGQQQVTVNRVVDVDGQVTTVPFSITLAVPGRDDVQLLQPVIEKASNNAYKVPVDLADLRVYDGYLKMSGLRVRSGTQLNFAIFKKNGENGEYLGTAIPSAPVVPGQDASWDAELEMKLPPGMEPWSEAKGFVLALAFTANGNFHRYSDPASAARVDFEVASDKTRLRISSAPVIKRRDGKADPPKDGEVFLSTDKRFVVTGTVTGTDTKLLRDSRVVVFLNDNPREVKDVVIQEDKSWSAAVEVDAETTYKVTAATLLGRDLYGDRSNATTLRVRSSGPSVARVDRTDAALEGIKVTFDEPIKLVDDKDTSIDLNKAFILQGQQPSNKPQVAVTFKPVLDTDNSITLPYKDVPPDVYTFTVKAALIKNLFGTPMEKDSPHQLFRPIGAEEPAISRGITGPTGPYVPFGEYTKPRPFIDGFNPSDHVETRVSRLYYYRDAHRVAQIVNRDAKSYNRAAVEMQQQLANKSHQIADQATDDRRSKERSAIRAAQKTREAERELQEAEQSAQRSSNEAANAQRDLQQTDSQLRAMPQDDPKRANLEAHAKNLTNVVGSLESVAAAARNRAQSASNKVQQFREEEARAQEQWQSSIAVEDRAREEQFRREVAAAHADPDTYAPGKPGSKDPVQQVSVSVIGEGLIQLRGPMKGINIIRTMINQIDAPVGQVRVGVHTVQINGEKGDRMEVVAGKIQRYIDHSRFLTLQSAEMLRKAIVQVAAQRAMELGNVPGMTQEQRDRSYLYSFFGADFIHELEAMDSEFLGTGNKLLSIHSMDSTSLASAMFIMALAKNSTRMQILQTFEGMMVGELPMAEQNYFEAGLTCGGKEKLFGKYCKPEEFQMLSENARFQSIRGMFNVEIAEDDTMTPFQREFVRLAQIFKSRLIVEMELKQRIMERSVIEERLGNREKELNDAAEKEQEAQRHLNNAQVAVTEAQKAVFLAANSIQAKIGAVRKQVVQANDLVTNAEEFTQSYFDEVLAWTVELGYESMRDFTDQQPIRAENVYRLLKQQQASLFEPLGNKSVGAKLREYSNAIIEKADLVVEEEDEQFTIIVKWKGQDIGITIGTEDEKDPNKVTVDPAGLKVLREALMQQIIAAEAIQQTLSSFTYDSIHKEYLRTANELLNQVNQRKAVDAEVLDNLHNALTMFSLFKKVVTHVLEKSGAIEKDMNAVVAGLGDEGANVSQAYVDWLAIEELVMRVTNEELQAVARTQFAAASEAFRQLLASKLDYEHSIRNAEASRRPLDHKKFLDMLVDEMEDKYIELLEGTRAHTANIDAYIKRLITSLDDDFNTQFYYPTFRKVREASQLWDVQMGQVETTTVLANNRAFAKVSPQATMEFDLPKRDIVIAEAMNGAKAMMNDFGALAQDPTFLAMAQMNGGSPTSSPMAGATGGQATVRNVLPGLSTDTAESVMGQHGPGGSQFGAAMEALIPDPAIYKFETGTGWEIRPVIQPDGQALVFDFNYMYTTNIREPVRADEKHLGRVKRHFVDTDVQLSNFELREISRYTVALKASRTSRGVPLFEDMPVVGVLFRPLPSDESSLQQNIIMGQATIFPTVFDLMGLRWAPVVADLDPLRLSNDEFVVRNRRRALTNRVFDHSSSEVDKFLRIPDGERRMDLYRSQETIPSIHPNGYQGPGANLRDSQLQEGYDPTRRPESQFVPSESIEGSPHLRSRRRQPDPYEVPLYQPQAAPGGYDNSSFRRQTGSQTGVANVHYRSPVGDTRYPAQQAEYVRTQPGRPEPRPSSRMQRLPTVDGTSPAFPGQVGR